MVYFLSFNSFDSLLYSKNRKGMQIKPRQIPHFARQIEQFKLIALRGNESLRICTEYSSYFSRRFLILALTCCILSSCKIKPEGKDKTGWFVYDNVCIKSHKANGLRTQLVGKTTIVVPYTYTVCDKYKTVKKYLSIDKIDTKKTK